MLIPNHAKRRLQDGHLSIGLGLRYARGVEIAPIAQACGFDWIWIDGEHSAIDVDAATQIATAALGYGITPMVRVASHAHEHSTRVLDNGAQGVVLPHVDTPEQARAIAAFTRFPPLGHRSIGGTMPQARFANVPVGDLMRAANEETLVVAMIESPAGLANCEAIAAVPGIDVLLIGTNDLCAELGIPGRFEDPQVIAAYERVIAACRAHGKFPGMGGVYAPEPLARYVGMGMRFILAGSEVSFLMAGAKERSGFLAALDPKRG